MDDKRHSSPRSRAEAFTDRLSIRLPILLAPMAGACPPSLSIAVANAGGLGACGALLMTPEAIEDWSAEFRQQSKGEFQLNLWIPGPTPVRDFESEKQQREYLATWGPPVPSEAGDAVLPDFDAQCQAMITMAPKAVSSIMGLYAPAFVSELKAHGILWLATATTVAEARAAEAAGADAIVAQGMEAGGHRGTFHADEAERQMVGLIALVPQVVDAVTVPVIATGGIADARGVAAALILGASAVQIGTGFLRCPEAMVHPAYAGPTWADGSPRNYGYARIHWAAWAQRDNSVCSCIYCSECSTSGSVSCPARTHSRHAGRCAEGGRRRADANVGRPGRQVGAD